MAPSTFPWGVTYVGYGDLRKTAANIEAVSAAVGMACQREVLSSETLRITAIQTAPWHRIIAKALVQKVVWQIASNGEQLEVYSDVRIFRWYSIFLADIALVIFFCFSLHIKAMQGWRLDTGGRILIGGLGAMIALPLAIWTAYLLSALTDAREALWDKVLAKNNEEDGYLEPVGTGISLRARVLYAGYISYIIVLTTWLISTQGRRSSLTFPGSAATFAGLFCALCAVVLLVAFLMIARQGFSLRALPIHNGLLCSASIAFYGIPFFLWYIFETVMGRHVVSFLQIQRPVNYPALRYLSWLCIFWATFFFFLSMYLMFSAIFFQIRSRAGLHWLKARSGRGVYGRTLRDASLRRWVRFTFGAFWICSAAIGAVTLAGGLLCILQGMQDFVPVLDEKQIRTFKFSSGIIAVAVGRPPVDPMVHLVVRGGWMIYGLVAWLLFLVSTGQLLVSRRADLRRLRASTLAPPSPRQATARQVLADLSLRARLPSPGLVVVAGDPCIRADFKLFGLIRRQYFVEVSGGAIERLDHRQMEALLAHELAHLFLRHSLNYNLLRWLGRFTFVGDGFVLAMQDSLGYEHEADRTAVCELGAEREALLSCLEEIKNESNKEHPPGHADRLPICLRWRDALQFFSSQYFGSTTRFHYWHPTLEERAAALRQLECHDLH